MNIETAINYLRGNLDNEEKKRFEDWLMISVENQKEYADFKRDWELSGKAFTGSDHDENSAWIKLKTQMDKAERNDHKTAGFNRRSLLKTASVLIILIASGAFLYSILSVPRSVSQTQLLYRADSAIKEIMLTDGTKIVLNKYSKIEIDSAFNQSKREVVLTGEAFFEVARNTEKPFIIEASRTVTEVLGTSFNVNAKNNTENIIVTVNTGKVAFYKVADPEQKVLLTPGERGIYSISDKSLSKETSNNKNYLAWKTGEIIFTNASLQEIVYTLSECYNVDITIEGSRDKKFSYSGSFKNDSLYRVIEIIGYTLDIQFEQEGNRLIIKL